VAGCSDTGWSPAGDRGPGTSFARKRAYLRHLRSEDDGGVLRVSLADKLHNARAILADHRRRSDGVWDRFNVGRLGQLWYYRELVRAFAERLPGDGQAEELARVVAELRRRAGDPSDEELDGTASMLG
jgi:hypothetical protein